MALTKIPRGLLDTGIADSSDATAITIDSSENATFAGHIRFADDKKTIFGAGDDLHIYHSGGHNYIDVSTSDQDLIFKGTDGGSDMTALTLDMSDAGAAIFNSGHAVVSGATYATLRLEENDATDVNTTMFNSGGDFAITTSSDDRATTTDRFRLDHATGDIGFYKANGSAQALFWDASAESLGIGTTSPTAKLHIEVADNTEFLKATITGNEAWAFKGASGSGVTDYVSFGISGGTQAMAWQEDGKVGIGTTAPGASLHIFNNESGGTSTLRLRNSHTDKITRIQLEDSQGSVGDGLIAYVHSDASTSNHYLGLGVNNQTALSITNNDYVGINNTGPLYPIDAYGSTEIQGRFRSTGGTGYTQGAIVIESSESTNSPGDRGQGVYLFNQGTDKTWYMGTTYADASSFQISVVGGSTLQKIAASNQSGEGALRINSSRIVTLPKHPAFIAYGGGSGWTIVNGVVHLDTPGGSNWNEAYDNAGNFDPTNGRFTAPVTGYYLFVFHSYTRANHTSGYVYPNFYVGSNLWQNGSNTMIQHYIGHGDEDYGIANTAHIYLTANQYVRVGYSQHGNSNSISYHSNSLGFSGHLIG